MVVTGRAHREAVRRPAARGRPRTSVLAEPSARDSMAAIGLAAALLERSRPGRGDGLLRRRPRDRRPARPSPTCVRDRRRGRPRRTGWSRSASSRRSRPRRSATSTSATPCRATPAHAGCRSSSRSRRSRWPRSTSPPAATAGTPACSWSARRVLLDLLGAVAPGVRRDAARRSRPTRTASTSSGRRCPRSPSTTPSPSRPRTPAGSRSCRRRSTGTTSATSTRWPPCSSRPAGAGRRRARRRRARCGPSTATGLVVPGSGRVVAVVGLDDVVVVDTPDALLVTTRARAQEVKQVVDRASRRPAAPT